MPMNPSERACRPLDNLMTLRGSAFLARLVLPLLGMSLVLPLAEGAEGAVAGSASGQTTVSTSRAAASPSVKRTRTSSAAARARARKARLSRVLAARRAREMRELAVPKFKMQEDGMLVPDIRAAAAVIYNPATQAVLWEENGEDARSIASITKVMTAVVFLESAYDPNEQVEVEPADVYRSSHTYLRSREIVRVEDLLHLLLIASDNAAARTLARITPYGSEGFIDEMNAKADQLGLTHTHYADPSGLDPDNVSSARDMARLIAFAAADERIASVMRKADHRLTTSRRTFTINSTNRLLGTGLDVRGGKTGFIRSAGYCLATLLRLPQTDQQVAVVVLGARSSAGRFMETRHLVNWISQKAQELVGVQAPAQ
jgi:D-alanyl-D-alanine endopeptidase (penicillin-binding protein 7)